MEYYIRESNWVQIFEFLRSEKGIHSKNEKRLRVFMEAVWYMVRSGCQWRLLPETYGNYRSIHRKVVWKGNFGKATQIYTRSRFGSAYDRWHNRPSSCLFCWIQEEFWSSRSIGTKQRWLYDENSCSRWCSRKSVKIYAYSRSKKWHYTGRNTDKKRL